MSTKNQNFHPPAPKKLFTKIENGEGNSWQNRRHWQCLHEIYKAWATLTRQVWVKKNRLKNCVITGKSVRRLRARGKEVPAYSIRHDDFPGEEFHVAKSNFKVELSCTLDSNIFEDELPGQQPQRRERASAARPQNRVGTNSVVPKNQQEHDATRNGEANPIAQHHCRVQTGLTQQEILELRNEDIEIDDDNKALPENLQPLTEEEAANIVQNN